MQQALLPTAATTLRGLTLDEQAHTALMGRMEADARRLEADLDEICGGQIDNHGSSQQVSTWILEEVLAVPIKPPAEPKLVGLSDHLRAKGGLRPDAGGELKRRNLGKLVRRNGAMSLGEATQEAWNAGYIRPDLSRWDDELPSEADLLAALDREKFERVLADRDGVDDNRTWREYLVEKDNFDRLHKDDDYRLSHFAMRLAARTGGAVKGWRTTETGHLAITKGTKLRKAEQLAEAFPFVSRYLIAHARWTKAAKLLHAFGPTLRRWQDDDKRVRGQAKVWAAWTGRQSCVDPNLQNQPLEPEFRALWVAPPGRKLVIADYCLTGDTPVVTVDGIRPIADVVARPSAVLSMAPGRALEFREVERAALIGIAPVVKITFEDGSTVRCTEDHEWVDRSGRTVKTADLKLGSRLEHIHDGYAGPMRYPTWYVRSNREYVYKHRLVAEYVLGPRPADHDVDHVDVDVRHWAARNLRYLPVYENRSTAAGRWWGKANAMQRTTKLAALARGRRENRRSYVGAGNPNFGKRKGKPATCPTCSGAFYASPSRQQIYCSSECYPRSSGNHCVVTIEPAGLEPIYHLTIEQNHNFVLGNGLVSSNSQIELRLLAIESGDEVMRQIYRDGRDIHAEVASIAFGMPLAAVDKETRRRAKAVGFGIAYGSGASGLAEHGGFELAEAQVILTRVLETCPGLATYRERMPVEAAAKGYIAIRPNRRVLYDPAVSSPTQSINAPIQGGAASVQMLAMRLIHDALKVRPELDAFLCASIHDEFLIEAPADGQTQEVSRLLVENMVKALLAIFPEAGDMGLARLTAADAVDAWSQKP